MFHTMEKELQKSQEELCHTKKDCSQMKAEMKNEKRQNAGLLKRLEERAELNANLERVSIGLIQQTKKQQAALQASQEVLQGSQEASSEEMKRCTAMIDNLVKKNASMEKDMRESMNVEHDIRRKFEQMQSKMCSNISKMTNLQQALRKKEKELKSKKSTESDLRSVNVKFQKMEKAYSNSTKRMKDMSKEMKMVERIKVKLQKELMQKTKLIKKAPKRKALKFKKASKLKKVVPKVKTSVKTSKVQDQSEQQLQIQKNQSNKVLIKKIKKKK